MVEIELYHHGVKGMKWGVRRYQNPDGTLTAKGKKRYTNSDGSLNKSGVRFKARLDKKANKTATMVSKAGAYAEKYKSESEGLKIAETLLVGDTSRRQSVNNYKHAKEFAIEKYGNVKTSKTTKNGQAYFNTKIKANGKVYNSSVPIVTKTGSKNLHIETPEGAAHRDAAKRLERYTNTGSRFVNAIMRDWSSRHNEIADYYDVK